MTTSTRPDVAADFDAATNPTYDGPGALEILRRLRGLGGFTEHAANAVEAKDVERAYAAACRAVEEAASIRDALALARPAEVLGVVAREKRRIALDWEPDPTRGGEPLVDGVHADPVLVSLVDLVDLLRTCTCGNVFGPMPDGAGRVALHIAAQQPHRLADFVVAAGNRMRDIRAALIRADALPTELQ